MPERRGNWDDFARFIRWSQPPSAYVAPSPRQPAASPAQPRSVRDQREAAGLLTPIAMVSYAQAGCSSTIGNRSAAIAELTLMKRRFC